LRFYYSRRRLRRDKSFDPASDLLGRDVGVLAWIGPVVAAFLLLIGCRFWLFGLRHYANTGS
jgi:ABC-type uncharacterized transport system permease subunit